MDYNARARSTSLLPPKLFSVSIPTAALSGSLDFGLLSSVRSIPYGTPVSRYPQAGLRPLPTLSALVFPRGWTTPVILVGFGHIGSLA